MREDALRQRQSGGHQERGPVDRVEADDLLADQVQVGGPEVLAFDRAHVSGQRVEPDVEDVVAFDRHRDAPLDGRAADRKIVQPLLDERDHFVAARLGLDEIRLLFVELQQLVLKRRELEEVVLFGDGLGRTAAVGARIAGLGIVDVQLVEHAVLAGVRALVDVAVVEAALKQLLHDLGVCALVVRWKKSMSRSSVFHWSRNSAEITSVNSCGDLSGGLRGAFDLLAVLVGAGREISVVTLHALDALDGVGGDGRVGVADVRARR